MRLLRHVWARRPLVLYFFVVFVVGAMLFSYYVDHLVSEYEETLDRDAKTGVMRGAEERSLGDAEASRAILFVHGYIGSPNNYHDLPDVIAEMGWRAEVMRLPGHGTTPRDFERTTADELVNAVLDRLRALRQRHEVVVLAGHSMGGAISTIAAAQEPVDGLILYAPYFGLTSDEDAWISVGTFTPAAALLFRWVPSWNGGAPIALEENKEKIVSYHWFPATSALVALELAERATQEQTIDAIQSPILLVHSRADTVTSPLAAERIVGKMPAADKTQVWLEKSDHVIFWDYERQETIDATIGFLERWDTPPDDYVTISPAGGPVSDDAL